MNRKISSQSPTDEQQPAEEPAAEAVAEEIPAEPVAEAQPESEPSTESEPPVTSSASVDELGKSDEERDDCSHGLRILPQNKVQPKAC